jgi:hypothetical protein
MKTLLYIALCTLVTSCVTFKKCADKFGNIEQQAIVLHDTINDTVITPWDSLSGFIPCPDFQDTLIRVSYATDTVTVRSESGKAQISYWYNQYLKAIAYKVDCPPDTVIREIPIQIEGKCPDVVVLDPKNASGWYRWWHTYQVFSGWALLIALAGWIIYRKTNNKTIMYVEKDPTEDN